MKPVDIPGGRYHYSDTNYTLLGLLLEKLGSKPLAFVFRERLLEPLGMRDTYLSYREPSPNHIIESHRYEKHHDLFARKHQSADWASGGLVSTATDLIRFLTALENGRLFHNPSTLREMQSWHPTDITGVDYGLGMFRVELPGSKGQLEGHDGHGNSWLYYWPRRHLAFAGTLNQTENDWWPLVKRAIGIIEREFPK
jgi:D-alanyl-D-alanine carboxypeptidase